MKILMDDGLGEQDEMEVNVLSNDEEPLDTPSKCRTLLSTISIRR
jgi:hypothetical protein